MNASTIDTLVRKATVTTTIAVGLCSAVLSYSGLHALGVAAGIPTALAILLPLAVDGLIVVGAATTLHATVAGQSTRFGWTVTLVGVAASVYGNAASVAGLSGVELWQSRLVHSFAPVALALCIEAAMLSMRRAAVDVIEAEAAQLRRIEAERRRAQAAAGRPSRKGTKKPVNAPLSDEVLDAARQRLAAGRSFRQIAEEFPMRSHTAWFRILKSDDGAVA